MRRSETTGKNDQLGEAFSRLTLLQLAHALGLELKRGAGQKSPFRDDKKAGSFSLQDSYFKDHAHPEHSGGHIKFVEMARPGWSKKECIEFIIKAAGLEPTPYSAGTARRIDKENRQKLFKNREMEMQALPKVKESGLWSDDVRDRWIDGLDQPAESWDKLGASRGWGYCITGEVVDLEKMSAPALPWGNKRGCAFKVERPVLTNAGRDLGLVPVGYHQRWIKKTENGLQKKWFFVPYIPQEPKTDFQQILKSDGKSVPAYPFVLGDRPQGDDQQGNVLSTPKLVIITEGQWDAISLAAAFGWLSDGFPYGVCVLGLRGVQSFKPVLAGYGAWLQRHRPFVWFVGDNDSAGKAVLERKDPEKITGEPSFIDRLRALGCKVAPRFYAVDGCKDFNDIYKAHKWGAAEMKKLAIEAGCGGLI